MRRIFASHLIYFLREKKTSIAVVRSFKNAIVDKKK